METACSRCERDESGSSAADDQCRWGSCRGNGDSAPPPRRDAAAGPTPTALACSDHRRAGILRESRRGAGVGPSGVSPELARKIRTAQTEPSGIHRWRRSQYESRAGGCCGAGISQAGRRQRRSGRGSWAPARHISGARRERARRSTAQPEDQFRRSEPRRIVQGANEGHLHGSGAPVAA